VIAVSGSLSRIGAASAQANSVTMKMRERLALFMLIKGKYTSTMRQTYSLGRESQNWQSLTAVFRRFTRALPFGTILPGEWTLERRSRQ
jgi:hypothetical protein